MDIVRTIIYSACVIGVISTFVEMSAPEGSMKKQLELILGIVLMLAVITPFMKSDFRIRLSDYACEYDKKLSASISTYETQTVLNEASRAVKEYITGKLRDNGIETEDIIITLELDEYNQIEIRKVQVKTQSLEANKISELIHSELAKTEVIVTAGESS